jgi:hypothetical protein
MSDFDLFFQAYGQPTEGERADPKLLSTYKDIVPASLLEFWERFGFGGYEEGLVWVVNPSQLEDILAEWTLAKSNKKRVIPVIRTAFGNIIYWHDAAFTFLDVHYNKRFQAGSDVEVLFDFYLVDKKSRKSVLEETLFKRALRALGKLKWNEMYSYKLPLAMGGTPELNNMEKAKMREHLSILANIH